MSKNGDDWGNHGIVSTNRYSWFWHGLIDSKMDMITESLAGLAGSPASRLASGSGSRWKSGHERVGRCGAIPIAGWSRMEYPIKIDDFGVPLFLETPVSGGWFTTGIAVPWCSRFSDKAMHDGIKHLYSENPNLEVCLERSNPKKDWSWIRTYHWLVASTRLKNISQLGWFFPIYG